MRTLLLCRFIGGAGDEAVRYSIGGNHYNNIHGHHLPPPVPNSSAGIGLVSVSEDAGIVGSLAGHSAETVG